MHLSLPLPIRSVTELPDFPYHSFAAFRQAVDEGRAQVWVSHDLRAIWTLSKVSERILHLILTGSAIWYSLFLAVWAMTSHHYWLMLGIPAALLGFGGAHPNFNMVQGCLPHLLLLIGIVALVMSGWPSFFAWAAAYATWLLTSAGLAVGVQQIRNAMVKSEEALIWLCSQSIILVRDEG